MSHLVYPSPLQPLSRQRLIALWYQYHGPTWVLLIGVYGTWLAVTMGGGDWPWWVVMTLGALALCIYGSLQHELIHGHLRLSQRWADRLVGLPLSLWLPYRLYRDSHIAHHDCPELTDPVGDPESYYVTDTAWDAMRPWQRGLLWCQQTLLGRIVIGPWLAWIAIGREAWRALRHGDSTSRRLWLEHVLGVALVLAWLWVWEFPLVSYWLLVVWPGTSLMLVRSFHEHRPAASQAQASAIVEAGIVWRWLFLNNNYHVLHHRHPEIPWFRLHQRYWQDREEWLAVNGAYCYPGYLSWLWHFGVVPRDHPRWVSGTVAARVPQLTTIPEEPNNNAQHTPATGDYRRP